jgi:SAM-dependent methyltransferase
MIQCAMHQDPKQGEREYFARIGATGIDHSNRKPFSDENCPMILANLDALFHLLPPPPATLIEFGCGVGWLSLLLAQRGYDVTGVDLSPEAITAAQNQGVARGLPNARFVVADYESFTPDAQFDYVIFYDSLHHAEDEMAAMRCAHSVLRPGGAMIAFEPRDGHSQTSTSIAAIEKYRVHEKDMPVSRIAQLGEKAGFSRHLILPRSHELMRSLYRPSYRLATSSVDLKARLILSKLRAIRRLFSRADEKFIVLWK